MNAWAQIQDNWYLFGTDGKMMTGWAKVDQDYFYLNTDGRMLIGWLSDSEGSKYYMDMTNGKMSVGWKQIDGKVVLLQQQRSPDDRLDPGRQQVLLLKSGRRRPDDSRNYLKYQRYLLQF